MSDPQEVARRKAFLEAANRFHGADYDKRWNEAARVDRRTRRHGDEPLGPRRHLLGYRTTMDRNIDMAALTNLDEKFQGFGANAATTNYVADRRGQMRAGAHDAYAASRARTAATERDEGPLTPGFTVTYRPRRSRRLPRP